MHAVHAALEIVAYDVCQGYVAKHGTEQVQMYIPTSQGSPCYPSTHSLRSALPSCRWELLLKTDNFRRLPSAGVRIIRSGTLSWLNFDRSILFAMTFSFGMPRDRGELSERCKHGAHILKNKDRIQWRRYISTLTRPTSSDSSMKHSDLHRLTAVAMRHCLQESLP